MEGTPRDADIVRLSTDVEVLDGGRSGGGGSSGSGRINSSQRGGGGGDIRRTGDR